MSNSLPRWRLCLLVLRLLPFEFHVVSDQQNALYYEENANDYAKKPLKEYHEYFEDYVNDAMLEEMQLPWERILGCCMKKRRV